MVEITPKKFRRKKVEETKKVLIDVGDGAAIPSKEDVGLFTAWRVAFFGSIGLTVFLCIFKPDPYLEIMRFVPDGILVTFEVTVMSIVLALFIGLFTGLGRISKNKFINGIASLYVEVIRGIPLLAQLFYIYHLLRPGPVHPASAPAQRGHRHGGLLRRLHGRDLPGRHPVNSQGTD